MENERIARMEESLKIMAPRMERMEMKIDKILESYWKIYGAVVVIAFLTTSVIEMLRK